jgi:hypothetical protein
MRDLIYTQNPSRERNENLTADDRLAETDSILGVRKRSAKQGNCHALLDSLDARFQCKRVTFLTEATFEAKE